MKKVKVYAELTKEHLHTKGQQIGLTDEPLGMFMCFTEIELELSVDDDGVVRECRALWMED